MGYYFVDIFFFMMVFHLRFWYWRTRSFIDKFSLFKNAEKKKKKKKEKYMVSIAILHNTKTCIA